MDRNSTSSRLILGSASPRRRTLLATLGLPFECGTAHGVDESAVTRTAHECVTQLARRKAEAVLAQVNVSRDDAALRVLGADTVVAVSASGRDEILGKPSDSDHARAMLAQLAGSTHEVYTAVALAIPNETVRVEVEVTQVTFRALSAYDIDAYVASGEPDGKAGAYAIQGQGRSLVAGLRGCYYNVVGLPLARTARLLGVPYTCDCTRCDLQRGTAGCG
jgi:septum formation protein